MNLELPNDDQRAKREQRELELKAMLASHNGRNQLTQLLRQHMNLPTGQIPPGTPFVKTILDFELAAQPAAQPAAVALAPAA